MPIDKDTVSKVSNLARIKIDNFLMSLIYVLIYQIIIKPINRNNIPVSLSLLFGIFSIILSIFFILDGKMARKRPSIKKSNPTAVISSFTIFL